MPGTISTGTPAPRQGFAHQQRVDRVLRHGVVRPALGDGNEFGIGPGKRENGRIDQAVMHDEAGTLDQPRGAQRQQIRIARACADEVDRSGLEGLSMHHEALDAHAPADPQIRLTLAELSQTWAARPLPIGQVRSRVVQR
jgi:hypothetical protein